MIHPVFQDLAVQVVPEARDVYRISIQPRPAAAAATGETPCCRSDDGTTEVRWQGEWLEAHRAGETNGPAIWRGRFSLLATYGRAHVPGTRLEWEAQPGEAIYGLGQRFNGLNQAGKHVEMWIRDAPGQGDQGKASYFCTPVLFSTAGYALFAADNPEGEFSLNPLGEGFNRYLRAGQTWTLYLALAPTLKELVQQRTVLQGPFRGVPDWAWGPWISRNSYENQGEAEEAIHGMLQRGFPVAAIVQEAWKGASGTGNFNNFSRDRWPDVDGFLRMCERHGIRNVLWQVPIAHPTAPDFAEAERRGFFVRKPDGSVSWRREWLEGFANIDFTNLDAVRWWQDQMRDELRRASIRGFKSDDGEDIKADDVFADGRRGWQVHNEYSALYAKALHELFDQENVDGMLWGRSGSLGCERTPALWAGDQFATWAQYRSLLPAGLSAGLSGATFWGHDIGGYIDDPSPELYMRWLQFGAFSPLMQYHGVRRREPWEFGKEAEEAYRLLSHLRMNLRPTLMALGREAERTGLPLMRPMAMEFPDDPRFRDEDSQYMLGPDLLVAPVLEEGVYGRRITFPAGAWQHLLFPCSFEGPSELDVPIDLVAAPVFVRQGASLSVELAEGAKLGTWSNGAPVRVLAYDAGRAILTNLRFPLSASTLNGQATISFAVRHGYTGTLQAASHPRGHPEQSSPLPLARDGARVELRCAVSRASNVVVVVRDEAHLLLAGTVQWQSPLTLDAEVVGSRFVDSGRRLVRARLVNRSDEALSVVLEAVAGEGTSIETATREIRLEPDSAWSGEWTLNIAAADEPTDAVARLTARSGGRMLAEAMVSFARPLRMAVAGPFPGREKEVFHTPYPPEWMTSPDAQFRAADGVVRWVALPAEHQVAHDGIDFEALWGERDHAAGYAMARVQTRAARDAELRIGADDTITVWLNGEKVFAKEVYRLAAWDQEIVPVRLNAGDNTLVFKVAQDRNPWRLLLHLTGSGGGALEGVTDSLDVDAFAGERPQEGPVVEAPRGIPLRIAGPFQLEHRDPAAPGW